MPSRLITPDEQEKSKLKFKNNIAGIHKISPKSNKFRVLVSYKALDEELQQIVEKVPDTYLWSLNGSFYVDSKETLDKAKLLIKNIISKTENNIDQPDLQEQKIRI